MNGDGTAPPVGGAQNDGEVCPNAKLARRFLAKKAASDEGPNLPAQESASTTLPALSPGRQRSERRLVSRVHERCHAAIEAVCKFSSVPPEFLGALTANESGGNAGASRFEPAVYRHLAAVASGRTAAYGSIHADDLRDEIVSMTHPKSGDFHAHFLPPAFGANHQEALAALPDEDLRELATSWGYTQIMGYHMVGRSGTVRDLLEPEFHYRVALELLAEFAAAFHLDPAHEFAEMFSCWNTGHPYGKTYDPHYVQNGLMRMEFYREAGEKVKG